MQPLTVFSMFDGISCGRIALERAGIPVKQYFTSEIDKYASAISRCNWNTTELGDITKVNFNDLPKLSLILCGAPCQDLSFSGKGKGLFKGDRSKLFFYFIECLENQEKRFGVRPKFIVEQVKMKKEYQEAMSSLIGVEPVLINSKDFSAQSRQRLYWTNIDVLPYDKSGLVLKDILETNPDKFKSGEASAIISGKKDSDCIQVSEANLKGMDIIKRVYSPEGKAPTLTTCGGGHREPKVAIAKDKWRALTPLECERLQTVPDNYTSQGLFYKDIKETNVADNFYYSPKMLAWIDRHGKRKNKKLRIQSDNDKVQMIEASHFKGCSSQRFFGIEDIKGLRYITPLECERAQTVPDNYTAHGAEVGGQYKKISNTQRYKALGNGWTVDVITHILKGL